MAGEEFENRLDYYAKAWLPARDVVLEAVNKRFEVDPSGQIVIFNQVRIPLLHCYILLIPRSASPCHGRSTSSPSKPFTRPTGKPRRSSMSSTRRARKSPMENGGSSVCPRPLKGSRTGRVCRKREYRWSRVKA